MAILTLPDDGSMTVWSITYLDPEFELSRAEGTVLLETKKLASN